MQSDVKIPTMEKSSQFQFGMLENSKYVFANLVIVGNLHDHVHHQLKAHLQSTSTK
jgi:hypothetical protein